MDAPIHSDDFVPYGNLMHISTAIVVFIGVFTLYLILFHSTKDMKLYKNYMFNFIFAATIFDIHTSLIASPLPIFPVPGMCAVGLFAEHFHRYYQFINFMITHFLLSYIGVSIFISLVFRYSALQGDLHFFRSKRGVALMALGIIAYPLPSAIAVFFGISNEEGTLEYVKINHPEYYDLFSHNVCFTFSKYSGMVIYAIVAAFQVSFVGGISIGAVVKIYRLLHEKKANFSAKTYEMHRRLIQSLCIQAFVHLSFLAVPTITGFLMVINSFGNIRMVSLTIMPLLSMHTAALGFTTIFAINPYRRAAISILLRPFRFCCKVTGFNLSPQNSVFNRHSSNK